MNQNATAVSEKPGAPSAAMDGAVEAGRGALFIGFAKIYFMITGSVQRIVLPWLVDSASFGAFSVVNNLTTIVSNTVVQSTVQAVSKFTAEDARQTEAVKRSALRMQAVLAIALGAIMLLGAPFIAGALHAPSYTNWFRLAALVPVFYCFYTVFVGSANGLRRFRTQASFDIGFSTLKTILLLGLAAVLGVTGAFAGFAAAAAIIVVISARVMGMPARNAPAFPTGPLVRFMGKVVAYAILINVVLNYDSLLLRRFAGAVASAERAGSLVGHYESLRTLALLPYQALIVITFVIFPLVSRSTFAEDRETTRAYVTQTLRLALILAAGMGLVIGARPGALLSILYKPEYGEGAHALPVLVAGECCLALLAVIASILNAAGRAGTTVGLVAVAVVVGSALARWLVPAAQPGPDMLLAAATATSAGMAASLLSALIFVRSRLGGGIPLATAGRVLLAGGAAALAGRFMPGHGKLAGLMAIAAVGVIYFGGLLALGELGAADRAKLARILRRRGPA